MDKMAKILVVFLGLMFVVAFVFSVQPCELKGRCIRQTGTADCNGTLK